MSFDLIAWMRHCALPLWSTAGVDARTGMFVEALDLAGRPLLDAPRRAMVQARQIFVFAEAEQRGWHPGAALAERAAETMIRLYRRDDGGWIFAAMSDGRPLDETRDFYAQAFVLLALAQLKRLTGSDRWLRLADATLGFLDRHLATPETGGYAEAIPATGGPRRQNPHMHLLEALLALDAAAPAGPYRHRAERLVDLFVSRFLHGSDHVVVEFYDAALRPLAGPPFAFEPGHHYEWAWLLTRPALRRACPDAPALGARLCDTAYRLGATSRGTVFDEVGEDGRVVVPSTRLWPVTEAVRATAFGLHGERACAADTGALLDALHRHFLSPAPAGCWIDRCDSDGRPSSTSVPASSLYHLVGAAGAVADTGAAIPLGEDSR